MPKEKETYGKYQGLVDDAKIKARRKKNGKSTYEAKDGTLITAYKNGRVVIEEVK